MLETSVTKGGRLFQLLSALTTISLCIGLWLDKFDDVEPEITREAASTMAFTFSKSLTMIRTEWQMQGRKPAVYFKEYNGDGKVIAERIIKTNRRGWAYATNEFNEIDCNLTWLAVVNTSMSISNANILGSFAALNKKLNIGPSIASQQVGLGLDNNSSATAGRDTDIGENNVSAVCRYIALNGIGFEYNLASGQVKVI